MRLKIIRLIIIFLFGMIVCELFYVQIIRGRYYFRLSKNNRIRVVPLEGGRGRIFDRNNVVIADNSVSYSVMVTPQEIQNQEKVFDFLSAVLKEDKALLIRRYQQKKFTPFAPVTIAEDISKEKAIVIEENKYLYPSIFVHEGFKRSYPLGEYAAHVVGYVDKINRSRMEKLKRYGYTPQSIIGYSGVEEYYDAYLKGGNGGQQVEVNSRGKQVRLLSLKEPTRGQDLTLTIDSRVQKMTHELLDGKQGVIVMMDMDNGEILALSSSPSFDPNYFLDSSKGRQLSKLFNDPAAPLLNRVTRSSLPPGSVFKAPLAVAGLDTKKINEGTTFDCTGYVELGGIKFGCTHIHGPQNLLESIAHSCNVYYYRLGKMLGPDVIHRYAAIFGFGKLTHIDLPHERAGNLPSRRQRMLSGKRWYEGDTLNFAIGQGDLLATPMQLTKMMAIIAREGWEVQPHVIKTIGGKEVEKYTFEQKVPIHPAVFQTVKKGLRATVKDYTGTAHVLDIPGLHVAGKTGTAQSSGNKEHHAWFAGYILSEKKNVAFCVLLEHGGSSQNACLIARQLLLSLQREQII